MVTKRLFTAISIPLSAQLEQSLVNLKMYLKNENIVWTNYKQLHITLRFYGEINKILIPEMINVLTNVASNCNYFNLELDKLMCFGDKFYPKVMFINVKENNKLINLKYSIDNNLKELKSGNNVKFKPHITIARIKKINNIEKFNKVIYKFYNAFEDNVFTNEFHLYESILTPEGPIYNIIKTFVLKK